MRINLTRSAICIVLAISMAGCVSMPTQQTFNRTAHTDIKTITVLETKPTDVNILFLNNPAGSFGLIGGLIAAGNQADMEKRENAIFKKAHFEPLPYFKQKLTEDMNKRGYQLIWPSSQVQTSKIERGPFGLRKSYMSTTSNAMLDVNFGFLGYAAAGAGKSSPYRPTVTMGARLISQDGKQNYFTDFIAYNNVFNMQKAIAIDPDERYAYPKFQDLEAADTASIEGLKIALDSVAAKLSEQL